MSDQQNSAVGGKAPEGRDDDPLILAIETCRGFVQDQNGTFAQRSAGNGEPLPLPVREGTAALGDHRVIALRQLAYELMCACQTGRGFDLRLGRLRVGQADVLGNGGRQHKRILQHDGHLRTNRVHLEIADIVTVNANAALSWILQAQQEARDRRFARPRWAHDGDHLAGRNPQLKPPEDRLTVAVAEMNVLELQPPAKARRGQRSGQVADVRHLLEEINDPFSRCCRFCETAGMLGKITHGFEGVLEIGKENEQLADAERVPKHQHRAIPKHQRGRDAYKDIGAALQRSRQALGLDPLFECPLLLSSEEAGGSLFEGESLDRSYSCHGLGDRRRHVTFAAPLLAADGLQISSEAYRREAEQR